MKRNHRFSSKNIMILIVVVSIISMVLTWEVRPSTSPIEQSITHVIVPLNKGVTYFGDWLTQRIKFFTSINELQTMNTELTKELDQLRYENKLLEQDKVELNNLRKLYELDQRYADYPKTGARIIGKDPGNWYEVFIIDKGTDDGLEVNMVVLAGNGLVGRIIEIAPNYAKVRSVIDDLSSVSAKILRTSDLCTVSGEKSLGDQGKALVQYIEEDVNLVVGDEIITSHLGDIYPPGIMIGVVESIETNPNKLTKTAVLQPVVDFKHLEEVLVINLSGNE